MTPAESLPLFVTDQYPGDWQRCGSGVFTWSVFRLYRATLHAPCSFDPIKPFALDLAYLRTIQAKQIVDTSLHEIERLAKCDTNLLTVWSARLLNILPDVVLGDRLIGLFLPSQGVMFFSQNQPLGDIMDPQFALAFSAIWLDPHTRSPALRAALLGLDQ